jgi:opacity protein-like surface antigen
MNTFVSTLYRDLTCGAAAILITLVLAAAFVQSTSVAPGQAGAGRVLALQTTYGWFGQPEPAVLVD